MFDEICSYAEIQKEIHDGARPLHCEWVEPDGASSMSDSYEAQFAELLRLFSSGEGRSTAYFETDK